MSSSSRKYYSYNNTTKLEYTATNGGCGSFSQNAAKNSSSSLKETRRTTAPMPAKKEKPVSKFRELLSYGVKPWDPDADDFYRALQEAFRKMDAQQNQDDCKTERNYTDSKWEDTDAKAVGSSSKNYARTTTTTTRSVKAKLTVTVKDQAKEEPMRKIEDLLTNGGFKPCDSEADDFCETFSEARGKFESCRIEDYESESSEYEYSNIESWEDEYSREIEPWDDVDSDY